MIFKVKKSFYKDITYTFCVLNRELGVWEREIKTKSVLDYSIWVTYSDILDVIQHLRLNSWSYHIYANVVNWKWLKWGDVLDEYDIPFRPEYLRWLYEQVPPKRWRNSYWGYKKRHYSSPKPHTMQERRWNLAAEQDGFIIRGGRKELPSSWDHRHSHEGRRNWKHFRRHQWHAIVN